MIFSCASSYSLPRLGHMWESAKVIATVVADVQYLRAVPLEWGRCRSAVQLQCHSCAGWAAR